MSSSLLNQSARHFHEFDRWVIVPRKPHQVGFHADGGSITFEDDQSAKKTIPSMGGRRHLLAIDGVDKVFHLPDPRSIDILENPPHGQDLIWLIDQKERVRGQNGCEICSLRAEDYACGSSGGGGARAMEEDEHHIGPESSLDHLPSFGDVPPLILTQRHGKISSLPGGPTPGVSKQIDTDQQKAAGYCCGLGPVIRGTDNENQNQGWNGDDGGGTNATFCIGKPALPNQI